MARIASANSEIDYVLKLLHEMEFSVSPQFMERELRVRIDLEEVAGRMFGQSLVDSVDIIKIRVGNELHAFKPVTHRDGFGYKMVHQGSRTIS